MSEELTSTNRPLAVIAALEKAATKRDRKALARLIQRDRSEQGAARSLGALKLWAWVKVR